MIMESIERFFKKTPFSCHFGRYINYNFTKKSQIGFHLLKTLYRFAIVNILTENHLVKQFIYQL